VTEAEKQARDAIKDQMAFTTDAIIGALHAAGLLCTKAERELVEAHFGFRTKPLDPCGTDEAWNRYARADNAVRAEREPKERWRVEYEVLKSGDDWVLGVKKQLTTFVGEYSRGIGPFRSEAEALAAKEGLEKVKSP